MQEDFREVNDEPERFRASEKPHRSESDSVDTSIIEKIDTLPEKVPGGASDPATESESSSRNPDRIPWDEATLMKCIAFRSNYEDGKDQYKFIRKNKVILVRDGEEIPILFKKGVPYIDTRSNVAKNKERTRVLEAQKAESIPKPERFRASEKPRQNTNSSLYSELQEIKKTLANLSKVSRPESSPSTAKIKPERFRASEKPTTTNPTPQPEKPERFRASEKPVMGDARARLDDFIRHTFFGVPRQT